MPIIIDATDDFGQGDFNISARWWAKRGRNLAVMSGYVSLRETTDE